MTAELSEHEAATLARFDAAPDADEACVEKVARAMWAADCNLYFDELSGATPQPYLRLAVAAIDAMRPAPDAPRADTALRESVESLAQQYRAVADASFNTFSADVYDEVAQDLRTALDTAS